jgi:hypothetical protein
MTTCYACDAAPVSDEHAPPKCLFPESKDVDDGTDYRRNLITVPSCETHNLRLSKDDEYFMVVCAVHFENNAVAVSHFGTKILRALKRSPAFSARALRDLRPATVLGQPSSAFTVDRRRICEVLDKTGRALSFHHLGQKQTGPSEVVAFAFGLDDEQTVPGLPFLEEAAKALFADVPKHGDNPDVFYYQVHRDRRGGVSFLLTFYGGFLAVVRFPGVHVSVGAA